jgi:hypothetical protein
MKRLFSYLLLLTSYLSLVGCNDEGEYSTWPCRFSYDNSLHLDPTLASAMNIDSRGVFCKIWESNMGGLVLHFQSNQGGDATHQQVTEMERLTNYILGINNGIIVGYQTLNDSPNGGFAAYDLQCPNCVRKHSSYTNPTYRLIMASSGIATCSVCDKRYDMNNRGVIQNGEQGDINLTQYVATTTGPFGYIFVHNR